VRESEIESHLVKRVKELGGEVRKVNWIGRRGAPDRLVMGVWSTRWLGNGTEYRSRDAIWVELKAPGEKAKPHQAREHKRMQAMGQRVEVIDSIEGVEELLS
jgi:hypothetical protein